MRQVGRTLAMQAMQALWSGGRQGILTTAENTHSSKDCYPGCHWCRFGLSAVMATICEPFFAAEAEQPMLSQPWNAWHCAVASASASAPCVYAE
jgi:hypothetical protein